MGKLDKQELIWELAPIYLHITTWREKKSLICLSTKSQAQSVRRVEQSSGY